MFAIIGLLIVFGSVFGGFVMEGGPMLMLNQPAEFVIIGGAALGAMLTATPAFVLKQLAQKLPHVFMPSKLNEAAFKELLQAMYDMFMNIKYNGLLSIENDLNDPPNSTILQKYPSIIHHTLALYFLCDSLKLVSSFGAKPEEVEAAMDVLMETDHEEGSLGVAALNRVSDAMPGLGIVAAVLGIIIALQSLDAPPEVLGHKIGAALVGTFLGLLLSYGMLQGIAANMETAHKEETRYLSVIREGVIAFVRGAEPMVAVEIARNAIFSHSRPKSTSMEELVGAIRPR